MWTHHYVGKFGLDSPIHWVTLWRLQLMLRIQCAKGRHCDKNNGWSSRHSSLENPWCRYGMETLSALLALCEGNPPVTGGFPSQTDQYCEVGLNELLDKLWNCRRFQTSWRLYDIWLFIPAMTFTLLHFTIWASLWMVFNKAGCCYLCVKQSGNSYVNNAQIKWLPLYFKIISKF